MKKIANLLLLLFLSSCVELGGSSKPSEFYRLSGIKKASAVSAAELDIGIERVVVATSLDRPQINHSEFHRWSEPLSSMLPKVLAEDLSVYMPNSKIGIKYLLEDTFSYSVVVEFNRLDSELDADWSVYKDGKLFSQKNTKLAAPAGKTYDDIVKTQSDLIAKLAKEIAQNIK